MFRYTRNSLYHPNNQLSSPYAPTAPAEPTVCLTPMPSLSETSLSTPAWDLLSWTPEHHPRVLTPPVSALSDHPLLQSHLLDVKVQAKLSGSQHKVAKTFISGSMYEGRPRILYMTYKMTYVMDPNWVTILHPNVKATDALLVILDGEHVGRFTLQICQTHHSSKTMALVTIIDHATGMQPNQTGIEVALPAEDLAIVQEMKVEKEWHTECMKARREQACTH